MWVLMRLHQLRNTALNCWSSVRLHSGATYWSEAPTVFFLSPPFEGVSFPRHISQQWETPPVSVFKYKAVSQESAATATAPSTRFSVDAAAMETTRPTSSFPHLLWRWKNAKRATTAYRSTTCYYNWLVTAGRRTLIRKGFFFLFIHSSFPSLNCCGDGSLIQNALHFFTILCNFKKSFCLAEENNVWKLFVSIFWHLNPD